MHRQVIRGFLRILTSLAVISGLLCTLTAAVKKKASEEKASSKSTSKAVTHKGNSAEHKSNSAEHKGDAAKHKGGTVAK